MVQLQHFFDYPHEEKRGWSRQFLWVMWMAKEERGERFQCDYSDSWQLKMKLLAPAWLVCLFTILSF